MVVVWRRGSGGRSSFSRSLSETRRGRSGVSPGSGALRNVLPTRDCGGRLTRKWCAGSEVAAGRPLGGRRSVAAATGAGSLWRRASTSLRSIPSASCLLLSQVNWVKPSHAKPRQAKPSQAKPSQGKASQGKPRQAKPSHAKPSQAKPLEQKHQSLSLFDLPSRAGGLSPGSAPAGVK